MSRKRWIKRVLAGLLTLGQAAGCKQQLFLEPGDYKDALMSSLPKGLETNPHEAITPSIVDRTSNGPATVLDPNRPARMITLKECIAIALEQGNTGLQSPGTNNFGFKNETIAQFTGRAVGGSDAVRVFAIDPAIAGAELERSLSKFDARWVSSMTWQKVDTPTPAQFLSFQNSRDAANLSTTLAKPLPTGGTAGITFSTDYSSFNNIPSSQRQNFVNPNYTPRLQFTFEQPVLRLFGVEVNQIAPSHPGSQLLNIQPSGGLNTEGILISRIRVDQTKADFDAKINFLLVNVETAYWNLFAAYYNLYAQEEGLRQALDGYLFIKSRVEIGSQPSQDLDQSRAQFERFRRQVYVARGQVLSAERQLRGLLNVRSDDGTRLVPIDEPNLAAYMPDFYEAANDALANRPELLLIRQDLKIQQLNLLLQRNLRRPDLRIFGQYDIAGLGTRLDGSAFADSAQTIPGNALQSMSQNNFNSWTAGFRLDIPVGFRDANAQVREAQLTLARSYFQLRDSEMKSLEFLVDQYRRVIETHMVIGPAKAERQYLQVYLAKAQQVIEIGKWDPNYFLNYLTVQQQLAAAIATEFRAVADYNSALAALEFAKGTIQRYNNVTVGEGPLPPWVSKKAADHIRERTEAALKLRERDQSVAPVEAVVGGVPVGPPTGSGILANLPPFAEKRPPVPENLPDVPAKDGKDPKDMKGVDPLPLPRPAPGQGMGMGMGSAGPNSRPFLPVPASQPPAPAAEDYFRPAGTASMPGRGATGPAAASVPAAPPANFPAVPTTPQSNPLPVPPSGGASLPVPPATSANYEPVPVGAIPNLPTPPPETRYPSR